MENKSNQKQNQQNNNEPNRPDEFSRGSFVVHQSQITNGVIKPRHLVAQTSPANGDTFYSDGTNFQVNKAFFVDPATGKILFGTAKDTDLYRYATNCLKTDGAMIINGDTTLGRLFDYGDQKFMNSSNGPTLIDRVTGTVYRLKVTSGVLGIETV